MAFVLDFLDGINGRFNLVMLASHFTSQLGFSKMSRQEAACVTKTSLISSESLFERKANTSWGLTG